MEKKKLEPHYYVFVLELNGELYECGARCSSEEDGFNMRILTNSTLPEEEIPETVVDAIDDWIEDTKGEYHQKYLMTLP